VKPVALTRRDDFRRVHGAGKRTRRNGVRIAAFARGDDDAARVGYAVARSAGPAVTRNRIKRRLRAAIRETELAPGFDIVVSGDAELAGLEFQVLVEKLRAGLAALGATG
jgi:ribonuclease P protein component